MDGKKHLHQSIQYCRREVEVTLSFHLHNSKILFRSNEVMVTRNGRWIVDLWFSFAIAVSFRNTRRVDWNLELEARLGNEAREVVVVVVVVRSRRSGSFCTTGLVNCMDFVDVKKERSVGTGTAQ